MSDVIQFFDPRPLRGLILPDDAPLVYSPSPPASARTVELLDVSLDPSGAFILSLQAEDHPPEQWRGSTEVLEGEDGAIGLTVPGHERLLFPAEERGRVTDLFMKLANRIY